MRENKGGVVSLCGQFPRPHIITDVSMQCGDASHFASACPSRAAGVGGGSGADRDRDECFIVGECCRADKVV